MKLHQLFQRIKLRSNFIILHLQIHRKYTTVIFLRVVQALLGVFELEPNFLLHAGIICAEHCLKERVIELDKKQCSGLFNCWGCLLNTSISRENFSIAE